MDKNKEIIFTPWKINNLEIKNRVVQTSMGGTSLFGWMKPSYFSKEAANFILERAKNNVGLILPGITPIKDMIGGKWIYQGKKKFKQLKSFMEEIHKTDSKLFVQLTAGFGRSLAINPLMCKIVKSKFLSFILKPFLNIDYMIASPSVLPNRWDPTVTCRALTLKEIEDSIKAFGITAKMLKEAGVDGVEIHAVHEGYLLDQFATKYTNFRKDKYGGSFENRYRFAVEIIKEIRKTCGKDFPVSLRYSVVSKTKGFGQGAVPGEKYTEVGRDFEESIKAAKYLQEAGYDMLNCDNGTYDAWYWSHPPMYMEPNCNCKEVTEIKKYVDIPVVAAGKMTFDVGAKLIKENKLDAIGIARQLLTDPATVKKVYEGKESDILPCIQCHNACFNFAKYGDTPNLQTIKDNAGMSRCALNPMTMQSKKYKLEKTKRPKKVAIIGGGIGGMESARILKIMGHEPTIFEKTDHLGGVFVLAATPIFKEDDRKLLKWYDKQIKDLKINVFYNKEIKSLDELKDYDKVIVATGSVDRKIKVKGHENIIDALDYLKDNDKVKGKVGIIGGGLTGCEIAYELLLAGKEPIIIENASDLMTSSKTPFPNSSFLRDYMNFKKVPLYLSSKLIEVKNDKTMIIQSQDKKEEVKVDYIISCIGYNSNPLFKESRKVKVIGDAKEVGSLKTVIWDAWDVCMKF